MSWISKNLTLDLLAIAIDGLSNVFDRIKAEPEDGSPWPVDNAEAPAPAEVEPAPDVPAAPTEPEPAAAEPAPEPEVDATQLLAQAQTLCRTIAQAGQVDWITGTLLPHFNVQSLTDIPAAQLPEVITMATTRTQENA